eukprot:2710691-Rhodomonas_salina.1
MRADAYGPGIKDMPLEDILKMPIPTSTVASTVTNPDSLFDPLTTAEFEIQAVETSEIEDHRGDLGIDLHPSLDFSNKPSGNRGGETADRGGKTADYEGETADRGGETVNRWGVKQNIECAPSAGILKPVKHPIFADKPPPYGESVKNWWDCERRAIDDVSDSELAEFIIGHSLTIPFPQEFWPGDIGVTFNGESYDTCVEERLYGKQLCLKVILTVCEGTLRRKLRRTQIAVLPISKPDDGVDISIRKALKIAALNTIICAGLTKNSSQHCANLKYIVSDSKTNAVPASTQNSYTQCYQGRGLSCIGDDGDADASTRNDGTVNMYTIAIPASHRYRPVAW